MNLIVAILRTASNFLQVFANHLEERALARTSKPLDDVDDAPMQVEQMPDVPDVTREEILARDERSEDGEDPVTASGTPPRGVPVILSTTQLPTPDVEGALSTDPSTPGNPLAGPSDPKPVEDDDDEDDDDGDDEDGGEETEESHEEARGDRHVPDPLPDPPILPAEPAKADDSDGDDEEDDDDGDDPDVDDDEADEAPRDPAPEVKPPAGSSSPIPAAPAPAVAPSPAKK